MAFLRLKRAINAVMFGHVDDMLHTCHIGDETRAFTRVYALIHILCDIGHDIRYNVDDILRIGAMSFAAMFSARAIARACT